MRENKNLVASKEIKYNRKENLFMTTLVPGTKVVINIIISKFTKKLIK